MRVVSVLPCSVRHTYNDDTAYGFCFVEKCKDDRLDFVREMLKVCQFIGVIIRVLNFSTRNTPITSFFSFDK
jgi:hypothetical protein